MAASGTDVDPKIVKVAITLGNIKPVAHDEFIGKSEPHITKIGLDLLHSFFQKKRTHFQARRIPRRKILSQVIQGQTTIDNVFDDDHVATGKIDIKVLHDPDDTTGLRRRAVGRHRHEVELNGKRDCASDIGHEHDCALEHGDEKWRSTGVIGGDFFSEFHDALLNGFVGNEDLTKMGIDIGMRMFVSGRRVSHAANVVQPSAVRCRHDPKLSIGSFDAAVPADVGGD